MAPWPIRRLGKGQILFTSGQEADRFYIVLSGRVKVFRLSPDGREQILHLFGPGHSVGEAALWAGDSFPASAQAIDAGRVLEVRGGQFRSALEAQPALALAIIASLSAKLRQFEALIADLSLKDVTGRLAGLLLEQARQAGRENFRLEWTKRDLAGRIGTVAESLSRALRKLEDAELISTRGRDVRILDPQALADLAHGPM